MGSWQDIKNERRPGFTIAEALVIVSILAVITIVLTMTHIYSSRVFARQQTDAVIRTQKAVVLREFGSAMREAIEVVSSRSFGGTLFTTSDDTLIVSLPALDVDGKAVTSATDAAVIYQDSVDSSLLKIEIDPDASSHRDARARVLAEDLSSLEFHYGLNDEGETEMVSMSFDLNRPYRDTQVSSETHVSHTLGNQ